ncbi:peptidase [Arenicella chitinivorans]|uniref:Peptidase n=1 Tax=Arenicella chitinivorans TaxID=1329800 RepID=A0A918RHN6_9GAMM|nr:PepSY-associated TM helix domain-containing protein [Arenicella chitinivorans]GGZ96887.1 peptidase [Arenicella chitinivorans]
MHTTTKSVSTSPTRQAWDWTKSDVAKRVFKIARWLHIYLSTTALAIVLFFSVTGFTLNHANWFSGAAKTGIDTYTLPDEISSALSDPAVFPTALVTEYLRREHGLSHPRSIDHDLELGEVSLDFPLPAGYAFVSILVPDQIIEIEHQSGNLWVLMNDLHKGRHTGAAWSTFIDFSAVIMTLLAVAGILILFQLKKYRNWGLALTIIGVLTPLIWYLLFVPNY